MSEQVPEAEEEERKIYDIAWKEYDDALATLRRTHNDAVEAAKKDLVNRKAEAWKVYRLGAERAWQRFKEKTGHVV